MTPLPRRAFLGGVAIILAVPIAACAQTPGRSEIAVYKTPTCACCDGWVRHLRDARFDVSVTVTTDLATLRSRHGMPDALASCHTALIGDYVIEGHVPAEDVRRLLIERPDAVGLSVPGMPLGSPGMETADGRRETYNTLLVLKDGRTRVFARHNA
ncbi:DUF411 domain-containing protein [uncultured Brevundimonas sp.]|uniref:DUF411 domain-containing protein n=1 Tax=uncultured Brevundimonas sp. TaxID=213418 RepID=UPI0030ECE643|tara:strand:+ start:89244 stop:89711 length:468 start_codon:yes stop_codon:yes gene_type:complete